MAELFDVIFTDLRSSKKNVNRLLATGILFALAGYLCVVAPYSQYKGQKRSLSEQHGHIKDAKQKAYDTLSCTQTRIKEYSDDLLKKTLPEIKLAIASRSSSRTFQIEILSGIREIDMPHQITEIGDKEIRLNNAVRWYIKAWFSILMTELQNEAMTPVLQLILRLKHGGKWVGEANVGNIVDEAVRNLQVYLDGLDSKMLSLYNSGDNQHIVHELQKEVEKVFAPVAAEVSRLLAMTEEGLGRNEAKMDDLESRVESFNKSQLGSVPVGLTDFIILFPLVIVMLVVLVTVALHKSSRLYTDLWREFTKDKTTNDSAVFQQFTDCWYLPPYSSVIQPLLLIVLLVISIGIFVLASCLIIGERELFAESDLFTLMSTTIESSNWNIFAGAYIFGTLVAVGCLWLILKTLRRISQELIG